MEFTTRLELQSQATRLFESQPYARGLRATNGSVTLHGDRFPTDLDPGRGWFSFCRLQFALVGDFQVELVPLHSPLLGESLLVSFPRLSYMLKFSRFPYLI